LSEVWCLLTTFTDKPESCFRSTACGAHHRSCGGCRPPHPRRCCRVQHPAIPLHFHLGDFLTLKKRLQQKKLDFALQLELVPLEDTPSLLRAQVGQLRQYVVLNRQSHLSSYASLHRSQLASEQYYVPAMNRELWNQFAQGLTRHGSDPQNIKFAYSMEELMLQLAFYGGYTILAEPVLAQLPANKNLTFIPLENDTVPAWAVWNRENISPALQLLLRELDIDL